MNLQELYLQQKKMLSEAGIDSPGFDAYQIMQSCLGMDKQKILLHRERNVTTQERLKVSEMANRRANGEPLQYLIGRWDFMGYEFIVGEGVLIPRSDTETLIYAACTEITQREYNNVKVLDLCGGSGSISIALARKFPYIKVTSLEISDHACEYFKKNIALNAVNNVSLIQQDVFKGPRADFIGEFDLLVSNPPYIPSEDIKHLQKEVQFEPTLALDGGNDGLDFYRCIQNKWLIALKERGTVILEVGINQAASVSDLFGEKNATVIKDAAGIDRIVMCRL